MNTDYKVVITDEAAQDLKKYIDYLVNVKKNSQAAISVLDDYDDTLQVLSASAGSLKPCDSPNMMARGLRRINFLRHNYYMLLTKTSHTIKVCRTLKTL